MTEKSSFLDISHITYAVGTSEHYAAARNDPENERLDALGQRQRAIRLGATALMGDGESHYLSPEGHAMKITALLTTFEQDLRTLNELRDQGASHEKKLRPLRKVIEFNHAVKEMIDTNPSLKFDEVLRFITAMNRQINGSDHAGPAFEHEVRGLLVGMSHEIAFEQILGHLMPEVDYRDATIEEDLNGADIFVSIGDSPMVPIDVKASAAKTEDSKDKALSKGYDSTHYIWSGVSHSEFDGGFRISNEAAAEKTPQVYAALREAVFEQAYNEQRRATR